jgi:hypothetical protein
MNNKNELIEECIESIRFTSEIIETQIKESWSNEETDYFRKLVDENLKRFSLLYNYK